MKRKHEETDERKDRLSVKCIVAPVQYIEDVFARDDTESTEVSDIAKDRVGSEYSFGSQPMIDSGPFEAVREIVDINSNNSRVTTSEQYSPGIVKESSGRKLLKFKYMKNNNHDEFR